MGRSPCCDENGLKKGPWTPEEDQKLVQHIQNHGLGSWRALPKLAGLNRCGKSCRLRWTNYLRPDIKRGKFSPEEEQTILNLHSILGNKWSAIATHLPGRTDNEIKNFWNTHLKKKLIQMGFDPMTHRPRTDDLFASLPHLIALANLKDLIDHRPWDDHAARLQAEAAHVAKIHYLQHLFQSVAATAGGRGGGNTILGAASTATMLDTGSSSSSILAPTSAATLIAPPAPSAMPNQIGNLTGQLSELRMVLPAAANFQPLLGNEEGGGACFAAIGEMELEGSSKAPQDGGGAAPPLVDGAASMPNVGDACSTSNYGADVAAGNFWPELLLDDAFMADFLLSQPSS